MSTPTIKIYNQQSQIDVLIESFQGPIGPQGNGLTDEQIQSAVDATAAATTAAANADAAREAIQGDLSSLKDTKADAITDTSARAASHDLYAQRGRLGVTLYGATTETGTGDKSPDNPYEISGVDVARVHAGGKNLIPYPYYNGDSYTNNGITFTVNKDGTITANGTATNNAYYWLFGETSAPDWIVPNVFYAFSGCPAGGGSDTYRIAFQGENDTTVTDVGSGAVCKFLSFAGKKRLFISVSAGVTVTNLVFKPILVCGQTIPTAYEPYLATTADLPLLPDGAPLMGNGTVDDTVENDVLSGCDKKIVLDGSEDETYTQSAVSPTVSGYRYKVSGIADAVPAVGNATAGYIYSDRLRNGTAEDSWFARPSINIDVSGIVYVFIDGITTVDDLRAYLAANPLTVYYRSTEYTPEKDLRVARVVRKWKQVICTGDENWKVSTVDGAIAGFFFEDSAKVRGAGLALCNMYDAVTYSSSDRVYIANTDYASVSDWTAYLLSLYEAGTPLFITYPLASAQTYVTDPLTLRKPDTLTTDTVTVTGSGETAVEYPHDTKHYIDSQIAAAVALALNR